MGKNKNTQISINYDIKSKEVRVVGEEYNDIYSLKDAIELAENAGLDLIEINPNQNPPICKISDFKKHLYELKKKEKEKEKANRQSKQEIKELRFGPNTDEHDFEFKKNHAINFLKKGDKVKSFVFFKGRELQFKDKGEELLLRLAKSVEEYGKVDNYPKLEGNRIIMFLSPKK